MRNWLALAMAAMLLRACGGGPQQPAQEAPLQFARTANDPARHGERLARVLGCIGCHGETLTGEDWSDPAFGTLWTANLTRVVRRHDDAALARIITSGRAGDGRELWEMPSYLFTALAPSDMAALIAFLRTRPEAGVDHPAPRFTEATQREIAAGTFKSSATQVREEGRIWPPDTAPSHGLARYIVRATCVECHRMNLAGGRPNPEAANRPDLRMVAAYDRAQFRRLLREGVAAGDREVGLMSQVSRGRYRHLTDAEIDAVYDYLRALGSGG